MITETQESYKEMSDREIMTFIKTTLDKTAEHDASNVLFYRYEKLVHRWWYILAKRLTNNTPYAYKDDYYADAYLAFHKAVAATHLEKIENDKWKFLGYFGFYLRSLVTTTVNRVFRHAENEKPLEIEAATGDTIVLSDISEHGIVESVEDTVIRQDETRRLKQAINKCTNTWPSNKKSLWEMRSNGSTIAEICKQIACSAWMYNKLLGEMRADLDLALSTT